MRVTKATASFRPLGINDRMKKVTAKASARST
jgi:hypothetical protein